MTIVGYVTLFPYFSCSCRKMEMVFTRSVYRAGTLKLQGKLPGLKHEQDTSSTASVVSQIKQNAGFY